MLLCTSLLYDTTPIHCTPLRLHPPVMNTPVICTLQGRYLNEVALAAPIISIIININIDMNTIIIIINVLLLLLLIIIRAGRPRHMHLGLRA